MTKQERIERATALLHQTLDTIRMGYGVAIVLREDYHAGTHLWPDVLALGVDDCVFYEFNPEKIPEAKP